MARKSKAQGDITDDFSGMIVPIHKSSKAKPAKAKKKSASKPRSKSFKPEIIGPFGSEMNQIMDQLVNFVSDLEASFQNSDIEVEDLEEFKKEKVDYSETNFIPFNNKLFCLQRIIKIFEDNDIEVEKFGKNSIIVMLENGCKIFVENSTHLEMIRMRMPLFFKPKVSRSKRLEFLNKLNNEIAMLRFFLEEDGVGVSCLDYHYGMGFNVSHFLSLVPVIEAITYEVYTDPFHNLLDPEEIAIYFD